MCPELKTIYRVIVLIKSIFYKDSMLWNWDKVKTNLPPFIPYLTGGDFLADELNLIPIHYGRSQYHRG